MSQIPNYNPYSSIEEPQPAGKSWWGRNWWWFLPGVIVLPILLCCGCCGGFMWFGMSTLEKSEPAQMALREINADAQVTAALGSPIELGWPDLESGKMELQDDGAFGWAEMRWRVKGPSGEGAMELEADKSGGTWTLYYLAVEVDGGQTIELIEDGQPVSPPSGPAAP